MKQRKRTRKLAHDELWSLWLDQYLAECKRHAGMADHIRDERNARLGILFDARNYKRQNETRGYK